MTQIWPNPRAVEANKTSDTTSSAPSTNEMIQSYLAHAQLMIAASFIQLALVISRSGLHVVDRADYDNFENAYDLAMFASTASTVILLALLCLAGWIAATSKASGFNAPIRNAIELYESPDGSLPRDIVVFLASLGLLIIGLFVLGWLHSKKLITNGMDSAGMDVLSVWGAISCLVFAVVRIRKAMKLMSEDEVV